MGNVADRYRTERASPNPTTQEVARRQLVRLMRGHRPANDAAPQPSPWAHVPLTDLFAEQGNRVHHRNDGRLESGHEPVHASKSGRCVLIDPTAGRWWCRSCHTSGDAAGLVMSLHGWPYGQAAAWLALRYDRPARPSPRRRRRVAWLEA